MQCVQKLFVGTGKPIYQLSVSSAVSSASAAAVGEQGKVLLAARGLHEVTVLKALYAQQGSRQVQELHCHGFFVIIVAALYMYCTCTVHALHALHAQSTMSILANRIAIITTLHTDKSP